MPYNRSTDSTNGEDALSAGRQRTNYVQRFSEERTHGLKRHGGTLTPGFTRVSQAAPSNRRTELPPWSGTRNLTTPGQKRLAACWAALVMPTEGVDENFQSTLEILRFYCEQAEYEALYLESPQPPVAGVIGEVAQRQPMTLADS